MRNPCSFSGAARLLTTALHRVGPQGQCVCWTAGAPAHQSCAWMPNVGKEPKPPVTVPQSPLAVKNHCRQRGAMGAWQVGGQVSNSGRRQESTPLPPSLAAQRAMRLHHLLPVLHPHRPNVLAGGCLCRLRAWLAFQKSKMKDTAGEGWDGMKMGWPAVLPYQLAHSRAPVPLGAQATNNCCPHCAASPPRPPPPRRTAEPLGHAPHLAGGALHARRGEEAVDHDACAAGRRSS